MGVELPHTVCDASDATLGTLEVDHLHQASVGFCVSWPTRTNTILMKSDDKLLKLLNLKACLGMEFASFLIQSSALLESKWAPNSLHSCMFTWHESFLYLANGSLSGGRDDARETVRDLMDQFINDYLSINPK